MAWQNVGPGLLTGLLNTGNFKDVEILPSYYFLPRHATGIQYMGHAKVYAYQEWGSTKQTYDIMNTIELQDIYKEPKEWVSVLISSYNTRHKYIVECLDSIKAQNGHFGIEIVWINDGSNSLSTNLLEKTFVSTDKACSPINTYGMAKAISEQLIIEKAYYIKSIKFVNIRYGNVLNSRGSIIPLLHNIGKDERKENFILTHKDMTRFVMTLEQSVELIKYAIENGDSGDTIIPELVSMNLIDLLEIFSEKYKKPIKITSVRPGEKMLESLINPTQAARIIKKKSYYHIKSIFDFKEDIDCNKLIDYNSKLNPLSKEQLFTYLEERNLL